MGHPLIELDAAFKRGDMQAVRRGLGDPPDFPNGRGPSLAVGHIVLEYAIYHSPLPFIRELLAIGADPNYDNHAGFPALIAALTTQRPDRLEVLAALLEAGANPDEHGVNDYVALHYAVGLDDADAIALLLKHGADPTIRTRIDDLETPLELARVTGNHKATAAVEAANPAKATGGKR